LRAAATTTFRTAAEVSSPESVSLSGGANLKLDQGLWSLRHSIQVRRPEGDIAGEVTGRLLDSAGGLRSTLDGRSRLRVADIRGVLSLLDSVDLSVPPDMVEGLAGSMLASVDIGGTSERPHALIDLAVRELGSRLSPHTGALNATLAVDAQGVNVRQLQATVATAGCPCKVRLQLAADGTALIDTEPLAPLPAPPQVALATTAIDSQEPLLYHKTTWRPWYEGALQDHPGCLDVLFCNRRGEVTEGTFHNLVVEQHGRLVTPSVACGLLPGTLREELLAKGVVVERRITREELLAAPRLWLINSVRGWRRVVLCG
jgi:hypothetical protein